MTDSLKAATGDESACAIPVAPVKMEIGALRAPRGARGDRLRFISVVTLCLGLHAALLLMLMLEQQPEVTPIEEAIPVEVIVEPPPEEAAPEPAKAEEPPPAKAEEPPVKAEETPPEEAAQNIEEQPATDFARAAEQDNEDGKASEPADAETREPEAAPQEEAEVAPEPPPAPDAAPELASELPPPEKPAPRFAMLTPLPALQFKEPLAKRGDFPKGSADPGYLTTLYGLIMRKMPPMPKLARPGRGRVTFAIMSNGHIVQETIAIPSGAPFLDAAALGAVRRAAPFPAPPKGGPVRIRFDYGSN